MKKLLIALILCSLPAVVVAQTRVRKEQIKPCADGEILIANSTPAWTCATDASAFDPLAPTTTRGDLIYRNATVNARLAIGASGRVLTSDGTDPAWSTRDVGITVVMGTVGGSALTSGVQVYMSVPFTMTLTRWDLLSDASCTATLTVWKDTYANYPPLAGDEISGTEDPLLSSAQKNQDTSLGSFTTAWTKGDTIAINVESSPTCTCKQLSLTFYGTVP